MGLERASGTIVALVLWSGYSFGVGRVLWNGHRVFWMHLLP